jgi:serine/threonine protein kinase
MDPQAGARVSHYQLVRKLGSGGMGDVYLADDLDLGRAVAIKFLNAPTDARARQRLLNEARAAAALDHPVICGVHEVGSDPLRGDFIVMQYVEGETLAAAVNRGPMAREQALAIAADIADALAAAHQHGVVHRDLKPQNIVLQPSGRAKLLDFGIAKRTTSDHEAAEAATVTPLTRPHSMIGTPSYMSPEQVKGEAADARSDLFALGCVMYECITGRRAFGGATEGEVFGRILHAEPPPMSTVTRVDPDLDALVARLLRKSAAERFQSASEVVGAIRTLRGLTSRERWSRSRRRGRTSLSLASRSSLSQRSRCGGAVERCRRRRLRHAPGMTEASRLYVTGRMRRRARRSSKPLICSRITPLRTRVSPRPARNWTMKTARTMRCIVRRRSATDGECPVRNGCVLTPSAGRCCAIIHRRSTRTTACWLNGRTTRVCGLTPAGQKKPGVITIARWRSTPRPCR